jgi:hypothetical protein
MDDRRWGRGVRCTEAVAEDDAVVMGDVVEAVLARLVTEETVLAVVVVGDHLLFRARDHPALRT